MLPSYPLKYTWHHVIVGCIRFISSISLCPMFFLKIILWNVDQMMHPQYLAQFVLWTWPHSWDTLGENSPAAPAFVDLIKSLLHGKIMANSSVFLVEYPEINNKIINKIPIIFRISQHLPAFFIPNLHAAPRGAPPGHSTKRARWGRLAVEPPRRRMALQPGGSGARGARRDMFPL